MEQANNTEQAEPTLRGLYWIGGTAALIAAIIFRRNIGAEVSLFSAATFPSTVMEWFHLLQNNRLVGLAYLNLFDVVDYGLLGLMSLALYEALRPIHRGYMLLATVLSLVGMTLSFATNTALSLLFLSAQYGQATTEAQRAMYLSAGQALLAISSRPGAIAQSTGAYLSFLMMALAAVLVSVVMLRSKVFGRLCATIGFVAGGLDLLYCAAVVVLPVGVSSGVALGTLPLAGLLLMIWHLVIGWKLIRWGQYDNHPASASWRGRSL